MQRPRWTGQWPPPVAFCGQQPGARALSRTPLQARSAPVRHVLLRPPIMKTSTQPSSSLSSVETARLDNVTGGLALVERPSISAEQPGMAPPKYSGPWWDFVRNGGGRK